MDRSEKGDKGSQENYMVDTGHLREWINHGSDRRLIPGADIIKVQHALHRSCLHPPNDSLGVTAEQGCGFTCSKKNQPPHINLCPKAVMQHFIHTAAEKFPHSATSPTPNPRAALQEVADTSSKRKMKLQLKQPFQEFSIE